MFWKQPPPPPPPPDENEWSTLVGFAVAQAIFWFLISQSWSPLVKMIVSFVKSIPGGKSNVYLNLKAQYTGAGFPPPESEDAALSGHAFSYVCLIHHLCGTGLLVASYMYNSAFLFRFGLSFEIGEGVQHALQMLHAVFYPPGTPPVCDMSKAVWPFILFHHSLGLLAGTVAHLYLANNAEVQVLCALLLGAAVPGFANLPLFPFGDLQGTGTVAKINCILQLCAFTFMLYTRVINFFPLCYRLVPATFAEHGLVAGYAVLTGLSLFSLFNLVALLAGLAGLIYGIKTLISSPTPPPVTKVLSKQLSALTNSMAHDTLKPQLHMAALPLVAQFGLRLKHRAEKRRQEVEKKRI